ncbi:hypothetical protein D3C77_15940 [compost metagenome]
MSAGRTLLVNQVNLGCIHEARNVAGRRKGPTQYLDEDLRRVRKALAHSQAREIMSRVQMYSLPGTASH